MSHTPRRRVHLHFRQGSAAANSGTRRDGGGYRSMPFIAGDLSAAALHGAIPAPVAPVPLFAAALP